MPTRSVTRDEIARTYPLIAPHVRRTPVLEIAAEDLGLSGFAPVLKLELTQHSGSFKARGAFANLLLREVPPAGVAAASGGNHGAAVAYAAQRLGHKARIFVPEISSPAKIARIRGYGADLVVGGKVYADALAACQAWIAASGALSIHAFDQIETMLGAGSVGLELERPGARPRLAAGRRRRRRADRRHRRLVRGPGEGHRRRAAPRPHAQHGARRWPSGRRAGRRHCR